MKFVNKIFKTMCVCGFQYLKFYRFITKILCTSICSVISYFITHIFSPLFFCFFFFENSSYFMNMFRYFNYSMESMKYYSVLKNC